LSTLQEPYNTEGRRRSEPDALKAQRRDSTTAVSPNDKSQSPFRRLSRRISFIGPSSPASSVVDLTNSSMSTIWTADHTRLKSVEEQPAEVNAHDTGKHTLR
jgi:hypothetical protein